MADIKQPPNNLPPDDLEDGEQCVSAQAMFSATRGPGVKIIFSNTSLEEFNGKLLPVLNVPFRDVPGIVRVITQALRDCFPDQQ